MKTQQTELQFNCQTIHLQDSELGSNYFGELFLHVNEHWQNKTVT